MAKEQSPPKEKSKAKEKAPAAEAKPEVKEPVVDAKAFIHDAGVQELLQIVRQTALSAHSLVKDFETSQDPKKEQALRQLTYREQKNHADFRNRLGALLPRK